MSKPTSLSDLVYIALARHQTTAMTHLEKIAKVNGYQITHTMLSQIRLCKYNHRVQTPAIKALAFLSGVSVQKVSELAGRRPSLAPFAKQMPDEIDLLGGPAREALIKLMRVMIEMERGKSYEVEEEETGTTVVPGSELPFPLPPPEEEDEERRGKSS